MADHQPAGPPTHTVYYSGHHFQVAQEQAARIVEAANAAARNGTTAVMGIPAADTGNGHTVFRYFSIGPATSILVEGPDLRTSSGG
jgi:hypothetical protein